VLISCAGDDCLAPSRHGLTSSQISLVSTRGTSSRASMGEPDRITSVHSLSQDHMTPIPVRNRDAIFPSSRDGSSSTGDKGGVSPQLDERLVQGIMDKIQNRLVYQERAATDVQGPGPHGGTVHPDGTGWLLESSHLRMIIQTVLQEDRSSKRQSSMELRSKSHIGSFRQTKTLIKRPSLSSNAIELHSSTVADPATTISQPQTSFLSRSLDSGRVYTRFRPHEPKTTIVSRRSITDIKWLNNSNDTAITRWGTLETFGRASNQRLSACDSKFSVSTLRAVSASTTPPQDRFASFRGFSGSQRGTSTPHNSNKENSPNASTPVKRFSLESFPALLKREGTQDWLSPPAELASTPPAQETDDMYHLGIDARSGSVAPVPTVVIEEPVKQRQCNRELFHEDIFGSGMYSIPVTRRATEASITSLLSPELSPGASLGASSRKRRGNGTGKSGLSFIPLHKHQPGTPHFMDRLREGGKAVTRKLSAVLQGPIGARGTRAPAPSAESEDHAVEGGSQHRQMSLAGSTIEYLDPLVSFAASTTRRSYHDTCSEDHQPHQCENDSSPRMSPVLAGSSA